MRLTPTTPLPRFRTLTLAGMRLALWCIVLTASLSGCSNLFTLEEIPPQNDLAGDDAQDDPVEDALAEDLMEDPDPLPDDPQEDTGQEDEPPPDDDVQPPDDAQDCNQDATEICDGIDNDCDDMIDEGAISAEEACDTDQPGICSTGRASCEMGQVACVAVQEAIDELCNGQDDDCDGEVDEGLPNCETDLVVNNLEASQDVGRVVLSFDLLNEGPGQAPGYLYTVGLRDDNDPNRALLLFEGLTEPQPPGQNGAQRISLELGYPVVLGDAPLSLNVIIPRQTQITDPTRNNNLQSVLLDFELPCQWPTGNCNDANFEGADMSQSQLEGRAIYRVNFTDTDMSGSSFSRGTFNDSTFNGADLTGATMLSTNCYRCQFIDATLVEVNMNEIVGDDLNFTGANLSDAMLTNTRLLRGNFTNADLLGTIMSNTEFNGCNFTDADLTDAITTNASFPNAVWNGATCPDGTLANDHNPQNPTCDGHLDP